MTRAYKVTTRGALFAHAEVDPEDDFLRVGQRLRGECGIRRFWSTKIQKVEPIAWAEFERTVYQPNHKVEGGEE